MSKDVIFRYPFQESEDLISLIRGVEQQDWQVNRNVEIKEVKRAKDLT